MILVGSQRGGTNQLAAHLLNILDNDHIAVEDVRGFIADDLRGAMIEIDAIAKGTKCRQSVFSLSLSPPKDAQLDIEEFYKAADKAGEALGLAKQPRAIVIHEKNGRRHAHVVWSRIDAEQMKAVALPFYKNKLNQLSKELFLEHDWELPQGYRENGWKNPLNFTLAEWQLAKRLDLDPREIKQVFADAWKRSDNLASLKNALEENGYFLAKGDKRGVVALDLNGEVYSFARWAGIKTNGLREKLGHADVLPTVKEVQEQIGNKISKQRLDVLRRNREAKRAEVAPIVEAHHALVLEHRTERETLARKQSERGEREAKIRGDKFRKGLSGKVIDLLTGKLFQIKKQNEVEAFEAYQRDRLQRETLFNVQTKEREPLQKQIEEMRARHRQEHMTLARKIMDILRIKSQSERERTRGRSKAHERDFEL
jgi:hypothetical protein